MSTPPPIPPAKSGMSTPTKGCLGCLGLTGIGFVLMMIMAGVANHESKKSFEKDRLKIVSDMEAAAAAGNHAKVVEIGSPYESVGDYDFKKLLSASQAVLDKEERAKRPVQSSESSAAVAASSKAAAIGDVIKFEDSEWTVLSARDLGSTLRGGQFTEPKQSEGKFVYVKFKVKNITNEEESILFTPAITDSKGRRYEQFDEQAFYLPDNENSMTMEQLPSGLPKTFSAIFEIPPDAKGINFMSRNFAAFGKEEKAVSLGF